MPSVKLILTYALYLRVMSVVYIVKMEVTIALTGDRSIVDKVDKIR